MNKFIIITDVQFVNKKNYLKL